MTEVEQLGVNDLRENLDALDDPRSGAIEELIAVGHNKRPVAQTDIEKRKIGPVIPVVTLSPPSEPGQP